MSFLRVHVFRKGYNLILYNENNTVHERKYISFKNLSYILPELSKKHFNFIGWKFQDNLNNKEYYHKVEFLNPKKRKIIQLYPVFTKKEYYITFHSNDSDGYMKEDVFFSGEKKKISKNTFKKNGYYFWGWSNKKNSKEIDFIDGEEMEISENTDLFAVWYSYKVKYVSNLPNNTKVIYDYHIKGVPKELKKNVFSAQGYTFLGWGTKADSKIVEFKEQQRVIDLTKLNEITLYAVWEIRKNSIIFDSNGGKGMMKSIQTTNMSIKLPSNSFYYEGHNFQGWNLKSNLKTPKFSNNSDFTFTTSGTEVKLYAIWKLIFDEDFFGLTKNMTKTQKLSILNKEYIRYNNLMISNNPDKRNEAKTIIEGISFLRMRIKDEH